MPLAGGWGRTSRRGVSGVVSDSRHIATDLIITSLKFVYFCFVLKLYKSNVIIMNLSGSAEMP